MICVFDDQLKCIACGRTVLKKRIQQCSESRHVCRSGCHLSRLLHKLGITYAPGCGCESHAAAMDRNGPDWCRENIDTITGWMQDEAEKQGLPFAAFAARQLVRLAIRRAEREAAMHAGEAARVG